ncbi:sulfotransferase 1 [Desmophyllum pertusum]|uniref:Sulfotransferase 1 n=1 Tax=Desmophyllum pertusum TaxID=174260 RepID=A0A9W9Z3Y2_9CNID|nr:sulfotransferase 1 [Desmophyllum pertusum]
MVGSTDRTPTFLFLKYEDLKKADNDVISPRIYFPCAHDRQLPQQAAVRGSHQSHCRTVQFQWNDEECAKYWLRGKEDGPKLLRKGVVGDWKKQFTPELNERFDKEVLAKLKGSGLEFDFEM